MNSLQNVTSFLKVEMILYLRTNVSECIKSSNKNHLQTLELIYFMKGEHMALTNESPFVVCIDSDGCAMDTMDIKHIRFFGPLAAKYFEIKIKEVYLEEWNRKLTYSLKREGLIALKGYHLVSSLLKNTVKQLKTSQCLLTGAIIQHLFRINH